MSPSLNSKLAGKPSMIDTLKSRLSLAWLVGAGVVALLSTLFLVNWTTIEGHERAVTQNWNSGVNTQLLLPGTHFYSPLTTTVYKYDVGTKKFIMGSKTAKKISDGKVVESALYDEKERIDFPAFTITTGGSGQEQPATFSVTLQYFIDPTKLLALHNSVQNSYKELTIKPALTRIISDMATVRPVLDFYSGDGRVKLQKDIERAIMEHPALSDMGIRVETFVIDDIELDSQYVAEIVGRQIASQRKLRAIEDAGAAKEEANKVKEESRADKEKRVMAAEAKKQEAILAAEAEAESAKAIATADRYKKEQNAKGLLAQGLAEAQVDQAKKVSKYAGSAGRLQAMVEIEEARTERLKNMSLSGVVPEKTFMTLINGNDINKNSVLSVPASGQGSEE